MLRAQLLRLLCLPATPPVTKTQNANPNVVPSSPLRGAVSAARALVVPVAVVVAGTLASIAWITLAHGPVWMGPAGLAIIGAVCAALLVREALRTAVRYRGLEAIRSALACAADDTKDGFAQQSTGAMLVAAQLGPEAEVFATLLREREALRMAMLDRQIEAAVSAPSAAGAASGELTGACDALWLGFMLVGPDGRVLYANGAAGVLLARRRDELIGIDASSVLPEVPVRELLANVASGRVRARTSVEVRRARAEMPVAPDTKADASDRRGKAPSGAATLAPTGVVGNATVLKFTMRPVRREDSGAALVLIEDVTQQRVAEESRSSFVAQATHELRTPLTNIRLYVEELVELGDGDPAARGKCVNVINQEARRLERIVGDMLSVSEIEAGSLKLRSGDVRVGQLMDELEADYRAQAEAKGQTLVFDLPPKMPVLKGDRDKVAQALHNLLGNAVKYTPKGGTVTLRMSDAGGRFQVDVIDSGIGIKAEECELIFEKFYRAHDQRVANITGSGLGLALAREIARLHGGDITVKSELDKGSTFTLTLPTPAPEQAVSGGRKAA